jgi:hypothetical protein
MADPTWVERSNTIAQLTRELQSSRPLRRAIDFDTLSHALQTGAATFRMIDQHVSPVATRVGIMRRLIGSGIDAS